MNGTKWKWEPDKLNSSKPLKIYYLHSNYISHKRSAENNMRCMALCGYDLVSELTKADVVVLHTEPWHYAKIFAENPTLKNQYVIGYAVWETDILCDSYREGIQLLNEVWTCSSYCRAAFEKDFDPVTLIPHVVATPSTDEMIVKHLRNQLRLPNTGPIFYSIADNRSPRKNLGAAIKAFSQLPTSSDAHFLIKTPAPLAAGTITDSRIKNLHGMWPDEYIDGLHALCDGFVSTHHSEGWGLGISEAMAAGNIAIATGHGGNMEFMSHKNSLPVDFRLNHIRSEHLSWIPGLWSPAMSWAYVDHDDLVVKLNRCIDDWPATRKLRKRAIRDMRKFDFKSVALIIERRLEAIASDLGRPSSINARSKLSAVSA